MKKIVLVLILSLCSSCFCITYAKEIKKSYLMIEEYPKNNLTVEIVSISFDSTFTKIYVGFHTKESGHRVKIYAVGLYKEVFVEPIIYCNVYKGEEICFITFDVKPNNESIVKQLGTSDFIAEIADY